MWSYLFTIGRSLYINRLGSNLVLHGFFHFKWQKNHSKSEVDSVLLKLLNIQAEYFKIFHIRVLLHSDFEHFFNPIHGNCYTFNSGWNTTDEVRKSYETGKRKGVCNFLIEKVSLRVQHT